MGHSGQLDRHMRLGWSTMLENSCASPRRLCTKLGQHQQIGPRRKLHMQHVGHHPIDPRRNWCIRCRSDIARRRTTRRTHRLVLGRCRSTWRCPRSRGQPGSRRCRSTSMSPADRNRSWTKSTSRPCCRCSRTAAAPPRAPAAAAAAAAAECAAGPLDGALRFLKPTDLEVSQLGQAEPSIPRPGHGNRKPLPPQPL